MLKKNPQFFCFFLLLLLLAPLYINLKKIGERRLYLGIWLKDHCLFFSTLHQKPSLPNLLNHEFRGLNVKPFLFSYHDNQAEVAFILLLEISTTYTWKHIHT